MLSYTQTQKFFPLCNCSECSFSRGISAEDVFMKDGDRMSGGTLSLWSLFTLSGGHYVHLSSIYQHSVAALVIQEGNWLASEKVYRCQCSHNLTACQSASPGGHIGICGPDASVMDLHWMLLCFISVMLSFCVSCNCTDEETESSGDQASRLRHMWQLSMRDTKIREKGKTSLFIQNSFFTIRGNVNPNIYI